jgi:hypothetical protein
MFGNMVQTVFPKNLIFWYAFRYEKLFEKQPQSRWEMLSKKHVQPQKLTLASSWNTSLWFLRGILAENCDEEVLVLTNCHGMTSEFWLN